MRIDFWMVQGNTQPSIAATLQDATGSAINLTGATVKFQMTNHNTGVVVVDHAATVVSAAAGTVRYDWQPADTATAGLYRARWHITFSDNSTEDVPNAPTSGNPLDQDFLGISVTAKLV